MVSPLIELNRLEQRIIEKSAAIKKQKDVCGITALYEQIEEINIKIDAAVKANGIDILENELVGALLRLTSLSYP